MTSDEFFTSEANRASLWRVTSSSVSDRALERERDLRRQRVEAGDAWSRSARTRAGDRDQARELFAHEDRREVLEG